MHKHGRHDSSTHRNYFAPSRPHSHRTPRRLTVERLEARTLLSITLSSESFWASSTASNGPYDPNPLIDSTTSSPANLSESLQDNGSSVSTSINASLDVNESSLTITANAQATGQGSSSVLEAGSSMGASGVITLSTPSYVTLTVIVEGQNAYGQFLGPTKFYQFFPSIQTQYNIQGIWGAANYPFSFSDNAGGTASKMAAPNGRVTVDFTATPIGTATSTVVISYPNPSAYGQPVAFTAAVSSSAVGQSIPSGSITFMDGAQTLGTAPLDNNGTATFHTSTLAVGDHPAITATYSGDGTFSGSTSLPLDQVVTDAVVPTSLAWDDRLGGVDYSYRIDGGTLSQSTMIALYWSRDPTFATRIGGPIDGTSATIPAGTATGTYGPTHVRAQFLQNVPDGASYLLLVTDPNNALGSFSSTANVLAAANPLFVPAGQFTFNVEGNDDPKSRFFSREIYWPGGHSGVTIGRGYDLAGHGSVANILHDLTTAGIPIKQAEEIAAGARLSGKAARDFVLRNQAAIGDITWAEQQSLFNLDYPRYVARAEASYNRDSNGVVGATPWNSLDAAIQAILVDIVYNSGHLRKSAVNAADTDNYSVLVDYIQTRLRPSTRNAERVTYLEEYQ